MDNFPFGLSYVDLYDRYGKIRRTVRHCLAVYPHNDAYRNALLKLDRVLTAVIEDNQIMFNVIGKNAPLSTRGFDTNLATMLSSVSHETYKKCMEEYEMRKEDDRIRKRGNHDPDRVLKVVGEMNERVARGREK